MSLTHETSLRDSSGYVARATLQSVAFFLKDQTAFLGEEPHSQGQILRNLARSKKE